MSYNDVYKLVIEEIIGQGHFVESKKGGFIELQNYIFTLSNPTDRMVFSGVRKVNYEFAMKLAIWIINGYNDSEYLLGVNPNAKNYLEEKKDGESTFDTAYGPRFKAQLKGVLDELANDHSTRRAVITILDAKDQEILGKDVKTEYPCTNSLTFQIRDERLDLLVNMRSNNMVFTVVYDVFVFTMIQEFVYHTLKIRFPNLRLGTYTHFAASAHIFEKDIEIANAIIKDETTAFVRPGVK